MAKSVLFAVITCANLLNHVTLSSAVTTPGTTRSERIQAKACGEPIIIPYGRTNVVQDPYVQLTRPDGYPPAVPVHGTRAHYSCYEGYVLENLAAHVLTCTNGYWVGKKPICKPQLSCSRAPVVANSKCTVNGLDNPCDEHAVGNDVDIYYRCFDYFRMTGSRVLRCKDGEWSGTGPLCEPNAPAVTMCGDPPPLLHGDWNVYPVNLVSQQYPEDSHAVYFCLNGYTFEGYRPTVVCHAGRWNGSIPRCVKRLHCDLPQNIPDGNWMVLGPESKFSVGMTISYECNTGYAPYGNTKLKCLSSGYWSDNPPKCFAKGTYCPDPGKVENGFYVCQPQHCSIFSVGTTISYVCESGYEPRGDVQQTCLMGSVWSGAKPVCMPIITTPKVDATLGINSGTVTVVIATTCCVLGLLLVVMIVMALQRRKPSTRLCHPASVPPPPAYPRPRSNSMDEHDRVALIASADGVHVVLPSYEEATRGRGATSATRFHGDTQSLRRGDYRPLPTIPASMRSGTRLDSPRSGLGPDHHRNSIITNSSLARDNVSLVFGSMDTMNISDGTSTSVTIETFDSGASNPSLALSQRAVTGSLGSSNGSLANEDAPLLDNISESGRSLPPRSVPADPVIPDEQKPE